MLGLRDAEIMEVTFEEGGRREGFGRTGELPGKMTLRECAEHVKRVFGLDTVKVFGDLEQTVSRAAVLPGSGKSMVDAALKTGADVMISGDLYCTVKGNLTVDEKFLKSVEAYMRRLVDAGIPIEKKCLNTDDAIALFQKYGMKDKEKLFHYRRVSKVNLYSIDDFEDYNYGFMVPNTSYLKYFALKLYDDGFVLMTPGQKTPKTIPPFAPQRKIFQVQKESMEWGEMLEIPTVGALNDYIVHKDVHDLILIQEALQEQKIAEIAREIAGHRERKP